MNAAYTLRQETVTGSLEVGKLANLIVLDRNFFTNPTKTSPTSRCCRPLSAGGLCIKPRACVSPRRRRSHYSLETSESTKYLKFSALP
jgi:cytosine/adenosine deaminase-related metal-dependent hydrolase